MLVTDLHHLVDLPPDAPGSARRMAGHLGNIVRAATAGDAGTAWPSALPCRRRPGNRACPGQMIVQRTQAGGPIGWQCSACDDAGVISNWQDSIFDLRRPQLTLAKPAGEVIISGEVASALRDLLLLDPDCQRLVYRIRAHGDGAILAVTDDELEELIEAVAAQAHHQPNRRRQRLLDAALDALNDTAAAGR